jgi:Asp-tRNA(Asn)/Glu-tRNA(Gln) amidotransferase A subunit family amidase
MVVRLRGAGAEVIEHDLPPAFEEAHAVHRTIMYAEGARSFIELQHRQREKLSPRLNALVDEGIGIPDSDAAVTPPALGEAPADLTQTGDPAFCTIWSLCGVPAVTIPTGQGPNGLPLGLQIVGPRSADERVLAAAFWCDERIGWRRRIAG